MAALWFVIRVDLVDGGPAPALWPRPARVLVARQDMTFRMLADAIDAAFGRWGPPRSHTFVLADDVRIAQDRAARERLVRLAFGERFAYTQHAETDWSHLCTVDPMPTEPLATFATLPDRPAVIDGWGSLPDPSGRAWEGDDGRTPLAEPPSPPFSDLPDLLPWWGEGALELATLLDPDAAADADAGPNAVEWDEPWDASSLSRLRTAIEGDDLDAILQLFAVHDGAEVVHLVAPALTRAAASGAPRTRELGPLLVETLHGLSALLDERDTPGDVELAQEFRAALAVGAGAGQSASQGDQALTPTPVDLPTLGAVLDGPADPAFAWRLEVATGTLRGPSTDTEAGATSASASSASPSAERGTVMVLGSGPRTQVEDLTAFLDLDLGFGLDLGLDLSGRAGAVTGAPDLLAGAPDSMWRSIEQDLLRDPHQHLQWTTFAQERRLGRARRWLAGHGLRPQAPWDR